MSRDSVVIVGAGMMGSAIAAVAALAGKRAVLCDLDADRARAGVDKAILCAEELYQNGLADSGSKTIKYLSSDESLLVWEADFRSALPSAGIVIEAITENLEAKQLLFRELDRALPPEVPIASNTSGLRITDIAAYTRHPERTLTAHFWFPAHLVPLVEVVMGGRTSEATACSVRDILAGWGKAPVLVKKDVPGQLANRIFQSIIREAVNIVAMGLASPEDIDTAVKMGIGIRLPAWGPLEHVDGVGVDLCASVQSFVIPDISAETRPNPIFGQMIESGELGYKSGKGFYDWSCRDMGALARTRNRFIIEALKILKNKSDIV